jgi:cysteinyl-tRNA synthetase
MGHARTYLTFDILRRVMEDYFGYEILYVMNITDIDDKIILRARQRYLFAEYKAQAKQLSRELIEEVELAWKGYAKSNLFSASKSLQQALAPLDPVDSLINDFQRLKVIMDDSSNSATAAAVRQEVGEKFQMHWLRIEQVKLALGEARENIKAGRVSQPYVDRLLDDATQDIMAPVLDKLVCFLFYINIA